MSADDALLKLLGRFRDEGVEYVLIGGQAVRLNGYLRATEDVDLLVKASVLNGQKVIRAMAFLESSKDLDPAWFIPSADGEIVLDKPVLERIRAKLRKGNQPGGVGARGRSSRDGEPSR